MTNKNVTPTAGSLVQVKSRRYYRIHSVDTFEGVTTYGATQQRFTSACGWTDYGPYRRLSVNAVVAIIETPEVQS